VRFSEFNWGPGLFLIVYQILTITAVPLLFVFSPPGWWIIGTAIATFVICQLSITGGYHRYYAHKAFKASKPLQWILLFFGTLSIQQGVIRWSHDHRLHHRYVDTKKDPYSVKEGFWHAHFLWMMRKSPPVNYEVVKDLMKDPILRFQNKHFVLLAILVNVAYTLFFAWLFTDVWGAIVLIFLTRLFISHHSAWFINSLAHYYGTQPYSKEHTAVNNWIISFLTMGEGYHNYHHTFASDYRNGVRWYQWDPTKMLIWISNKIGLSYDLVRINKFSIKKRLVIEDKRLLLAKVKKLAYLKREYLVKEIEKINAKLQNHMANIQRLRMKYKILKKQKASRSKKIAVKKKTKDIL